MRQRIRNLIFASFCFAISMTSVVHAQKTFEGKIIMQMSSPMLGAEKIEMDYMVKGDKVLQTADDPSQGKMNIYTDTKIGTQIIVIEAQKQGMELDQTDVDAAVKKMNLPPLIPSQTGKSEKIAGYNCDVYSMMIDSTTEMDMWLTKEFPTDLSLGIRNCVDAGMKSTGVKSEALMNLFKTGYAPVRYEVKQKGVTQFTNEFVKAESKKIDDAIFIIPSNIKVTKFDPNTMGAPAGGAEGK